jgi:hypothetical protein
VRLIPVSHSGNGPVPNLFTGRVGAGSNCSGLVSCSWAALISAWNWDSQLIESSLAGVDGVLSMLKIGTEAVESAPVLASRADSHSGTLSPVAASGVPGMDPKLDSQSGISEPGPSFTPGKGPRLMVLPFNSRGSSGNFFAGLGAGCSSCGAGFEPESQSGMPDFPGRSASDNGAVLTACVDFMPSWSGGGSSRPGRSIGAAVVGAGAAEPVSSPPSLVNHSGTSRSSSDPSFPRPESQSGRSADAFESSCGKGG